MLTNDTILAKHITPYQLKRQSRGVRSFYSDTTSYNTLYDPKASHSGIEQAEPLPPPLWKYSRSKNLFCAAEQNVEIERKREKKKEGKLITRKIRQHKHEIGAFFPSPPPITPWILYPSLSKEQQESEAFSLIPPSSRHSATARRRSVSARSQGAA